jgi:hypothetical protein
VVDASRVRDVGVRTSRDFPLDAQRIPIFHSSGAASAGPATTERFDTALRDPGLSAISAAMANELVHHCSLPSLV